MARRRSGIAEALNAFNQAYKTTRGVMRDIDVAEAMEAKPEETTDLSPDQKRAVADSILDSGGVRPTLDGKDTVIAGRDGAPDQRLTPATTYTKFMGDTTEGKMTPQQVNSARMMRLADVESKYDPTRGMELRMRAQAEDRQAKKDAEEDAFKADQKKWWEGSTTARYQTDYLSRLKQYGEDTKAYQQKLKDGATPQELGAPPQQPTMQQPTMLDRLNDTTGLMAVQARYGRHDPNAWMSATKMIEDVRKSGAIESLNALHNGDAEGAIKAWNASGQNGNIDPKSVLSVTQVKTKINGADVDTYEMKVKMPDGSVKTINAAQQLNSYGAAGGAIDGYWKARSDARAEEQLGLSKKQFGLAENADRRSERADGRAATRDAREQREKAEKSAAGVTLFKEQNPGATPAQLEAARTGVIPVVPKEGGYKVGGSDVVTLLGDPAVDEKGKPIVDFNGRQIVNRNKGREDRFFAWAKENGIKDTDEALMRFKGLGLDREEKPKLVEGQVVNGMMYMGKDPKKKENWRPVGQTASGAVGR